ncbi:MAG: sigma 54-interacting transcriptional regulator [Vicinamibacterales bacterium]
MTATVVEHATLALLFAEGTERHELEPLLRSIGYTPIATTDMEAKTTGESVALCVIDLRRNGDIARMARALRAQHPRAVLIGVADADRPGLSAEAVRAGVFDVLPRPVSMRDLEALIANAEEQVALAAGRPPADTAAFPHGLVGTSPAMRQVMELAQRAAAGRCGILIAGERGSGRALIARTIHAHAPNPDAPFITVDCSTLAPSEVERQLFGTSVRRGAVSDWRSLERIGENCQLHEANGGILFLENLADLPARAQARLVRVLRDREVFVGRSDDPEPLDIRPIASIDGSADTASDNGRIRRDLYQRLSLIRVDVPPLRHRREDVPALATHFLKELCRANDTPIKTLTRPALTLLAALPWRGNAPELRSLLERLILLVPQGLIRLEDVLAHTQLEGSISPTGFDATLRQARARFERDYIAAVLQHQHGRITEAAHVLGIQRTNLYRKMRRLNPVRGKAGREA